jgi:Holliday junction resolvase-like predicted endonuclease
VRAALFYLKTHRCTDRRVRFDVIGIDYDKIKLVKNAFLVEEHG